MGRACEMKTRNARREPPIAIQGERGAFSEEAARRLLGQGVEILACPRFEDMFRCTEGRARPGRGSLPLSLACTVGGW